MKGLGIIAAILTSDVINLKVYNEMVLGIKVRIYARSIRFNPI